MPKPPKRLGFREEVYPLQDLLTVQLESYRNFLQEDVPPGERTLEGLHGLFTEVFPIEGIQGKYVLEYVNYEIGKPKISEEEALRKNLTYSVPLWVTFRLVPRDPKTGKVSGEIIEQRVYFANIPYMTKRGTFIINGVERVVVSQLHRSPGVYYEIEEKETTVYSALLVPYRGPWVRFTIDGTKVLGFTISKRKRLPVTRLLKVLGYKTNEEILKVLLEPKTVRLADIPEGDPELLSAEDVFDPETGEVLLETLGALDAETVQELRRKGVEEVKVYDHREPDVEVVVTTLRQDRIKEPQKAISNIYRTLRYTPPKDLQEAIEFIHSFFFSVERFYMAKVGRYKLNLRLRHEELGYPKPSDDTLNLTPDDLLVIIKRLLLLYKGEEQEDDVNDLASRRVRRVGELLYEHFRQAFTKLSKAIRERMLLGSAEVPAPKQLINPRLVTASISTFFTQDRLSQFLDQTNPLAELTHKRRLSALGKGGLTRETAGFEVRDVHPSHYGRLCPIETSEGQNIGLVLSLTTYAQVDEYGFVRTPLRRVKDGRLTDEVVLMPPHEEVNYYIASGGVPISSDGRIIPEKVLCRYNRSYVLVPREKIDFIDVSPRQIVSPTTSLIPFLEHDDANRALMGSNMQRQAVPLLVPEPPLVGTGMEEKIARDSGCLVLARRSGKVLEVDSRRIIVKPDRGKGLDIYDLVKFQRSNQNTLIDQRPVVKPGQRVKKGEVIAESVAVAERELALGKNLLVAFMPWYGYNFEDAIVISERIIKEDLLTSIHILEFEVEVRDTKLGPEEITRDLPYVPEDAVKHLDEYGIVRIGAEVKPDDILVGKVTPRGERELSPEERLIYAVFSERAKNVKDTSRRVPPGVKGVVVDVVVLTRVKNDPLSKRVLAERRRAAEERAKAARRAALDNFREALADLFEQGPDGKPVKPRHSVKDRFGNVVWRRRTEFKRDLFWNYDPYTELVWTLGWRKTEDGGKELVSIIPAENTMTPEELEELVFADRFVPKDMFTQFLKLVWETKKRLEEITEELKAELERIERGDELPAGVRQLVKVYVAQKRKFQVGDKLAGRHGNKGVCAIIVPEEDMPYFDDGTPVDIVLSPLGVPSRMNVGQILETMLGWAAVENTKRLKEIIESGDVEKLRQFLSALYKVHPDKNLRRWVKNAPEDKLLEHARELAERGVRYAAPVFEAMSLKDIQEQMRLAGLPENSKVYLRDGRSGEYFKEPVVVGYIYMMKLIHMVEDKIHARATGPYSLITQQPVGGKSHFGGQRFGEMEVWALEAHGAAYALQEMLTVKSDDIKGRNALFKAIVKGGDDYPAPSLPASFNVMVKELKGLALDVEVEVEEEGEEG